LRGAFHLSLTVLVPYRWPRVFSLGGWSPLLPTGFRVSRGTQAPDPPRPPPLVPTGLSPSLVGRPRPFGSDSVGMVIRGGVALRRSQSGPTTPPGPCCQDPGGLGCSRFARHYCGNLLLMSRPRGTEMFQFPRCPSHAYSIPRGMSPLARRRVAPFGSARLIARLQLPWHVSPLSAPFFGPWPLRHPPATLLRLARLHSRLRGQLAPTHAAT
jgi:hypothetical protein